MEVYPRSSWFLLLLGFALIAATLQETTDCPTPDQVSCTSGNKCSADEDCQEKEICCANACYTRRCTPNPKGVQGEAEADGPSETDCRPYIEKALKELEIGEVGHTQKEPSDKDESAEDIPTVEITDDSSHQEEDGGKGEASEVAEAGDDQSTESKWEGEAQQEAAQGSIEDDKSGEDSGKTHDEKEIEQSEEKAESEEDTKAEPSKEESVEDEQADKISAEDVSKEEQEVQQEAPDTASAESQEELQVEEAQIVKRDIPADIVESVPVQTTTGSQEDEQSIEVGEEQSAEKKDKNQEDDDESAEAPQEDSKEESVESVKSIEDSTEEKADSKDGDNEKADDKSDEDKTKAAGESTEHKKSEEQTTASAGSTEADGCPDPSQVSCTEGELCSKHRNCGEDHICCPNKCYRKRCIPGSVSKAELEAESVSEESQEEAKGEEKPVPTTPETGCPPPSKVSCTEGEFCSKHKQCGEEQICCPNKCYRKRCLPGTATSAELEAESDEDSKEESKETPQVEIVEKRPETGCPLPNQVSCTEGDLCSRHKHCGENTICCPNKCYRRRCTPGTATEEELAAEESDEDSKEEKEKAKSEEDKTVPRIEIGCPQPSEVSCTEGQLCSKHKQCGEYQICCPNKCYRRRCVPGQVTSAELEAESDEDLKEESTEETVSEKSRKSSDTGCPERDEVSCKGEKCAKNRECGDGEICCANKCYRKVCIPGTPGSEQEEESEEELTDNKSAEAKAESVVIEQEGDCPPLGKVSCTDGQKCGEDDDCSGGEICCPNNCYTRRCIPGPEGGDDESVEEGKIVQKVPPQPKVKAVKEVKEEVKEEAKVKAVPPPPPPPEPKKEAPKPEVKEPEVQKPEVKKPEVLKPELKKPEVPKPEVKKEEPKAPSKPVKVVEIVVEEDDESLEMIGEAPVEDLSLDTDLPTELRPRDHVEHLLKLDKDSSKLEIVQNKVYEETLKELKKLYENAIKPLEVVYKYRDLSNRHFGDAEIFSKPLILFMGPWSGGKSSIINYLINNEYNETSLRTGAEPSPAYFNILTYGDEPDIIDGTELAADFTFSGLQKFGQGLEERLRGVKLPSKLLEKVNIVEIPGILEVRKQVSRVFPFNDACQWFIDRADIIFLVYDPSKLDVGPETEAILDQLKGREHQTRIVLNKADQVKPEELMRVQGALIWNISPLMSSPQPPVMYTTSLWSRPYEPWAPVRLLQAQERAFLRDLRTAVDRRVENKIASARRFAVRVRNHAKMVDCYLTTYYNHKSVFGNRKQVANEIIEHPQDYHIYEGLSTLTNISRYDLPDPDVYKDFFKLNPLYEFQQLSATCTYFRGCPINRLDIAIAYDLPELVGTYKRNLEEALANANNPPKEPSTSQKTKKSAPGS